MPKKTSTAGARQRIKEALAKAKPNRVKWNKDKPRKVKGE